MEKEKKYTVPGAPLEEEISVKIRQALQTVDISSLAHISEVRLKQDEKKTDGCTHRRAVHIRCPYNIFPSRCVIPHIAQK